MQTEAYAFRSVPLQGIEKITDRVVTVFVFIGVIICIRTEKAVQTEAYAFRSVPLQGIEKITDRVVTVFVGNNRNCVYDFLLFDISAPVSAHEYEGEYSAFVDCHS